jgi:PAS domain S-box-containing protein
MSESEAQPTSIAPHYRQIAEAIPQIVYATDAAGRRTFVNQRWFDYTGLPPGPPQYEDVSVAIHPEDLPRVNAGWAEAMATPRIWEVSLRLRRHDGAYRWFLSRCVPLRTPAGEIEGWFGTSTDIHERIVAEQKAAFLADVSEKLTLTFDVMKRVNLAARLASDYFDGGCTIHLKESDGRIALAAVAHSSPEIEALAWEDNRKHPLDPDAPSGPAAVIRTGEAKLVESLTPASIQALTEDAARREQFLKLGLRSSINVPLSTDHGRLGAVSLVSTDRSYSKEDLDVAVDFAHRLSWAIENAQLYLDQTKSLTRLHSMFMQAPIGICILEGPAYTFTLANDQFRQFAGREVVGKTLLEAFPEATVGPFPELLDRVYRTGEPYSAREMFVPAHGDWEEFYLNLACHPFRDESGRIQGVLGFLHDVTPHVQARTQIQELVGGLKRAVDIRDEFLSIASHELKTPLTSLSLQVQSRQRTLEQKKSDAFTPERLAKYLATDLRQITRLNRLVSDMLDGSRISEGRLTIRREPFDLGELVREVLDRFSATAEAEGVELRPELCASLAGQWDRFRLEQVLLNLLTNALRYGNKQPVRIRLSQKDGSALLAVQDQGIGIAPENHARIFGRFERAISRHEASGLGLGLYIAQQIVQSHGGDIQVESALGHGATFTVLLPLA